MMAIHPLFGMITNLIRNSWPIFREVTAAVMIINLECNIMKNHGGVCTRMIEKSSRRPLSTFLLTKGGGVFLGAYSTSAMLNSNKSSQHISHSNMLQECSWTHHLLHTRQTISAMLSSNRVATIHNITLHAQQDALHTHPTAFHGRTILLCTQHDIVGEMAQDVGMV